MIGLFLHAICAGSAFAPPLILNSLVEHFSGPIAFPHSVLSPEKMWVLVCLLFIVPVTGVICGAHSFLVFLKIAASVKAAMLPAIYRKALRLSCSARLINSSGMIMNLFGNDITHIQLFLQNFADPLFAPAQLVAALALIYQQIGLSMFVGLVVVAAVMPLLGVAIAIMIKHRNEKIKQGDRRVKLTNEVLSGIRILKFYGWEGAYEQMIDQIRELEVKSLAAMNYVIPAFMILIISIPILMPVVMFYSFVKMGNQLDAAKSFTTLALFGLVMNPVMLIPIFIQTALTARLSMDRIDSFLSAEEMEDYVQGEGELLRDPEVVVRIRRANFSWMRTEDEEKIKEAKRKELEEEQKTKKTKDGKGAATTDADKVEHDEQQRLTLTQGDGKDGGGANRSIHTLMDIDLTIRRGQLVCVVGPVGSGKSSLLAALLGDLYLNPAEGAGVGVRGAVAYHSQVPWILNSTVRENILFGLPQEDWRFREALEASALGPDIAILPNGLETEIGERGINLSGGQKARISFCRAVYRDAPIVLLDDPLSAVDAHVAEKLFNKGVCETLVARGKTVVLVTHQVHLLDRCDLVVVVQEGRIAAQGSPSALRAQGVDFSGEGVKKSASTSSLQGALEHLASDERKTADDALPAQLQEKPAKAAPGAVGGVVVPVEVRRKDDETDTAKEADKLMSEEERSEGTVSRHVYYHYFSVGGFHHLALVVLICLGAQASVSYSAFYLSDWGKATIIQQMKAKFCEQTNYVYCDAQPLSSEDNISYLNMYAWLMMIYLAGSCLRSIFTIALGVNASRKMHRTLLRRILAAPVSFFDTTPIGRILNRFSADITQTDEKLGSAVGWCLGVFISMLGIIGSIAYTTKGLFLAMVPPLGLVYWRVQLFFRKTNTELKRLENISRSPIYSEFQEVLHGVSSLRAFGEQQSFIDRMESHLDENNNVNVLQAIVTWWLNIRLDIISGLTCFFVGALAAGYPEFLPQEYLGLALSNAGNLTAMMKMTVAQFATIEAMMR